jgi:hypothetical protein
MHARLLDIAEYEQAFQSQRPFLQLELYVRIPHERREAILDPRLSLGNRYTTNLEFDE